MNHANEIKVWDIFVRFFHWALVGAFLTAYLTEDDIMTLHAWAGYVILALLGLRIIWGFVGTDYARFSSFVFSPRTIVAYVKDTLLLRARRYLGHNPAGGAMILLMIASLVITTVTGIVVYGGEENAGPLANLVSERVGDGFEDVHEFFANFTLFLVFVHIAGVVIESLIHRENLVNAMITGYKRVLRRGEDAV
jgi:cytochrome b